MKTTSKIFSGIFYVLCASGLGAAFYGAIHQLALSGICLFVALILHHDLRKKEIASETSDDTI